MIIRSWCARGSSRKAEFMAYSGIASVSIACALLTGLARGVPAEGAGSEPIRRSSMSTVRHEPLYQRWQVEHPVDDRDDAEAQEMVGV